jgi:hypothetical protein
MVLSSNTLVVYRELPDGRDWGDPVDVSDEEGESVEKAR